MNELLKSLLANVQVREAIRLLVTALLAALLQDAGVTGAVIP